MVRPFVLGGVFAVGLASCGGDPTPPFASGGADTGTSTGEAREPSPVSSGPDRAETTSPADTSDAGMASGGAEPRGSTGGATTGRESASEGEGSGTGGPPLPPAVTWPLVNGVQWADVEGQPIQAHGGGMLKVGDDYYWFGENRNPDGTFYAVSAYRSKDLRRWEHVNDVLTMESDPGLRPANVERPKVVYNASTDRYVMWMHWENGMDYGEARAAVASSETVAGDYTYHGSFRPLQDTGVTDHGRPGYMSRDCTLFVDDDGTGYFLSTANENYDLHLYRLSDDYLSIEGREALLFEGDHREAPALFKRGDIYFLITSGSTGWSPNQAQYATSRSIGSGWSEMRNVADGNTFYSQSTYVLPVSGSEGTEYLYMGDRWAGAWGGRVNDSAYVWQPIAFPSDDTMSMSWYNTVDVDVATGRLTGGVHAFVFVNANSGLSLSVDGAADEDGADVVQMPQTGTERQQWRLHYDGAGYFRLTNEAGGKVLDVPDESVEPGLPLHVWEDHGGDNQAWRLVDVGQGRYRVRNKHSGHDLSVVSGSMEPAAAVEQQRETPGDEQLWRLELVE